MKSNLGTIGVSGKVKRLECLAANDKRHHTESIAKWAIDAGKSVGLVTTTRVTHASPAGLYAHSAERDWECNADVLKSNCDDTVVDDIAEQLVHSDIGRQLKVIFGGGRGKFYDRSTHNLQGHKGQRTDGRDLIQEWLNNGKTMDHRRTYVWNKVSILNGIGRKPLFILAVEFRREIWQISQPIIPTLFLACLMIRT